MYEKDGERYFVFDSHLHFWDASPENWVKGAEEYAKGWIECFHAYQGLGPPDTHWTLEHFQKYSVEDFEKDVFVDGHVDVGVFQSTYLKEWYTNGFNDIDQNAALLDRFPGRLILNGRWDPREGEAGLRQLEADHAKYGIQGVKLYTAEWYQGSRGWKLTDPGRGRSSTSVPSSASGTSTFTRARRSGRWTRTPSTSLTSTTSRPTTTAT